MAAEQTWDVAVIGAGPAGMFVARTLAGSLSVLVLDEKGRTGGAGAMTDGKLNLSPHIGLDLAELQMTEEEADARIVAVDDVFVAHGADRTVYGEDRERIDAWLDRVSWVRRRTPKGEWDITLRPARQRHMGTDLAHRVVARMTESITSAGARFSLDTRVEGISLGPGRPLRPAHGEGGAAREVRRGRTRARRRLLVPGGGPGARGRHALRGHRHRLPGGGGVPGLRRDHPRPVRSEVPLRHPHPRRPDADLLHQPGRPRSRGSAQRVPAGERRRPQNPQDGEHELRDPQHRVDDGADPGHDRDGAEGRRVRQLLGRRGEPGRAAPGGSDAGAPFPEGDVPLRRPRVRQDDADAAPRPGGDAGGHLLRLPRKDRRQPPGDPDAPVPRDPGRGAPLHGDLRPGDQVLRHEVRHRPLSRDERPEPVRRGRRGGKIPRDRRGRPQRLPRRRGDPPQGRSGRALM